MQDRPTAAELLETVAELLERDVLGAVEGPLRHQVRVAGNLCRILARESALGAQQETRAVEQLRELLGEGDDSRDAVALSRALVERLDGSDVELERRAWPVLLEIVRGKLAVNKPGHDAYDFAGEIPGSEDPKG